MRTNKLKNQKLISLIAVLSVACMLLTSCSAKTSSDIIISESSVLSESGLNEGEASKNEQSSVSNNSSVNTSSSKPSKPNVNNSSNSNSMPNDSKNKSTPPAITVATQVADGICVVGGICSVNTESIIISGENIAKTTIIPFAGATRNYFLAQIKCSDTTEIIAAAKEKGKDLSDSVSRFVWCQGMDENYMTAGEYSPVIGKNSQMHFYSALLSYSLSAKKVTEAMRQQANNNISNIVNAGNNVGAKTIFLIIPSSAHIYPETVPDGYTKNSGESLYDVFNSIATSCGATVMYPLDTMKKHAKDGKGLQIYQHTDSHWSTYGAYWGTYDLFQYISKSFPKAKPRTVAEMGFFTKELYGGDALFNFPTGIGFEDHRESGEASVTGIKELTSFYKLNMPTSTLSGVYNSNKGLYLTDYNSKAATVDNPNGADLPKALIMRDSFGKVAYDMINDRFQTVHWGEFNNHNLPVNKLNSLKPDYLIYLYSERNLLKIMLNNPGATILNLK